MNKVKKQECLQNIESLGFILKDLRAALEDAECTLLNIKSIIEEESHD